MLTDKEKLEEELKLLKESLELDVITKEEFENAKQRIDARLKYLEYLEQKKETEAKEEIEEPKPKEKKSKIKEEIKIKEQEEEIIEEMPVEEKSEEIEKEVQEEVQKKLEEAEEEKAEAEVEEKKSLEIEEEKPSEEVKKEETRGKEKTKIGGKIIFAVGIIIILSLGLWYTFQLKDSGVKDVSVGTLIGKNVIIACSSDKDCIEEGKIGICKNPKEKDAECEYVDDVKIKLMVINNDNCFNCETERVIAILKGFYPNLDVENIGFETDSGKGIVEKFNINALPAYIFNSSFKESRNYDKLSSSFNEIDGNFVMKNTVANANYYLGREEMPNKLDLFIMQGQNASLEAEENLKEFLGGFGNKVIFNKYDKNSKIAKEFEISAFPTFLINNKIKFSGVQSANTIKENFCEMNKLDECSLELSKSLV